MAGGRVYLVGAGPGDPELITARAIRRVGEADLVLYDSLVHPSLLEHAKDGAELVFVGKRGGRASARQAEIHERMIDGARAGKVVVRLKGGDPHLFGRGSEEAEALADARVAFEVVPGVPSPTAAAEYAGISLTHRDLSSSVAFVTASESKEKDRSSHDWAKLATGVETLVVFMALRRIEEVVELLIEHGRAPDCEALAISQATLPAQRTVAANLSDLARAVREARLESPVLLVVGRVVRLREKLSWYETKPLFGKRVLVTRPADRQQEIARMLRDEGAEPVALPAIEIAPPLDRERLLGAARAAASYDWIIFTSVHGVDGFFAALGEQALDARALGRARVCAIGTATEARLRIEGIRADLVPSEFRGEAVAEAVLARSAAPAGMRVLLPRAAVAREALPEILRNAGASVDVVETYRNVAAAGAAEKVRRSVAANDFDVVTFTAPSTVHETTRALGDPAAEELRRFVIASIGPVTTQAAEKLGIRVDVTARVYTARGLVDALREHFAQGRHLG